MESLFKKLEIRELSREFLPALEKFLTALKESGEDAFFHPHPIDCEHLQTIITNRKNDAYCLLMSGDEVVAYGLLRGWDAGFEIPSLGIAVHPDYQGSGLGRMFMGFLHAAARLRGAEKVRLKVYPHNEKAIRLYEHLGYEFGSVENEQRVGLYNLK